MKSLLLSVLLATTDGGTDAPRVGYATESAVLSLPDGGIVPVMRGCWFDSPTCVDLARERVACAERVRLAESKQVASPPGGIALAFVGGTVAGVLLTVAVGLAVWASTQPTPPPGQ